MLVAIIVAALLALVLVAMFVKMKPKTDAKDLPVVSNALGSPTQHASFSPQSSTTGAMLTKMSGPLVAAGRVPNHGDRLWADFRRCVSFDILYFGNKLLKLNDEALEDVYAILNITAPVRSFFGPLRDVGSRFASTSVETREVDEMVLDDIVDFIEKAMPDVLVERTIDHLAQMESAKNKGKAINEDDYSFIDDYVPENNIYLAPTGSSMGLHPDAANRRVHQVDPVYFNAEEATYDGADDTYFNVAQYALGGESDYGLMPNIRSGGEYSLGMEPTYGIGSENYSFGNGGYSDATNDPAYASGSSGGLTYAMGNSVNASYAMNDEYTAGDGTYALGNSSDTTYAMGNDYASGENVMADANYSRGDGSDNVYALGNSSQNAANSDYDLGSGETNYSDGTPKDTLYGMASGTRQLVAPSSATYDTAENMDPTYGVANASEVVDPTDATYDAAHHSDATYGIMNDESTYGLAASANRNDDTYDVGRANTYGVNSDTSVNAALYDYGGDETYAGDISYDFAEENQVSASGNLRRGSTRSISYTDAVKPDA